MSVAKPPEKPPVADASKAKVVEAKDEAKEKCLPPIGIFYWPESFCQIMPNFRGATECDAEVAGGFQD